MKVLLSNKDENGTEHIIGFRSKNIIIDERGDIKIPLSYEKLVTLEKEIKELKDKIIPIRGLRAKSGNIIDEACNMSKEDIEEVLHKFEEKKDTIQPIDFKALLEHEENKKKVIYGLFDNILEANLDGIKDIIGDNYTVKIVPKKGGANILSITDERSLGDRCCYIRYENVKPNKSFGYTKEEIEEYVQRIVIAFVMEYDK